MNRRHFLTGALAAGAVAPRVARGSQLWGTPPSATAGLLPGKGERTERLLEVHCYGGLSYYDSFYVVEEHGADDGTGWHLDAAQRRALYERDCGWDPSEPLTYFADDADGFAVKIGPAARALAQRPDLLARMRVVVMAHDQLPHVAAIPLMMTGKRLGDPRQAGFGTHVQRYFREQSPGYVPLSYHFLPNDFFDQDNLQIGDAGGAHTASMRPLTIKVRPDNPLPSLLRREAVGDRREAMDALAAFYVEQTQQRYTHPTAGSLRSRGLDGHAFASSALANSPALAEVLGDDFMPVVDTRSCGRRDPIYLPGMGLQAAIDLITHPTDPARCCTVIDGGFDALFAYDTHYGDHLTTQTRSLESMLETLVPQINLPGESDPTKIDLDTTMIAITTEFGRTPTREYNSAGSTGHNPFGFAVVLLGGAIQASHAGVHGAITAGGLGSGAVTPSELRAAMLASFGIHPFEDESFRVSDVLGAVDEVDATERLLTTVLGRSA